MAREEFKEGDKAIMELVGLGKEEVSIVRLEDGELNIYCPSQGYYPLSKALDNKDIILEKLSENE